jgi:dephospho-CoA kinase
LITGGSGAGKTTIAAVLARRGLASIDADDDPLLSRFVDPTGTVVELCVPRISSTAVTSRVALLAVRP